MAEELATTNMEAVVAELSDWAKRLPTQVGDPAGPFAKVLVQRAAAVVPVVSGDLAASIAAEGTDAGLAVVGGVVYAGWVEFGGTRGRDYVPEGRYVFPALVAGEAELLASAELVVQGSIDRYPWTKPTGG